MRNSLPAIHDDEAALKQRLQHAHDGPQKPRLHMLYLRATRQAQDRPQVARLLGVHRNPIRRWLALYARDEVRNLSTSGTQHELARGGHRPAALASLHKRGHGGECDRLVSELRNNPRGGTP